MHIKPASIAMEWSEWLNYQLKMITELRGSDAFKMWFKEGAESAQHHLATSVIPLDDVKKLMIALEFYAVGWNEKHARINDFKIAEKVFKNPAVQDDHGLRAKEAIATILTNFPQLKEK